MIRAITMLTLCAGAILAHGDEIPHRKAGLWQVVTQASTAQGKPITHKVCLDRDTEALVNRLSSGTLQQVCSKNDMRASGGKLLMHTVCGLMGSQQTSDVVITFNGDTRYTVEAHSRYEPPLMGRAESTTTQEGTWLSTCPAGMQPGELVMTDSRGRESHLNLRNLLHSAP